MADFNAAATLQQAGDFASNYANATLEIKEGATVLASYALAGFATSNSGNNGLATANAIAQVTNNASGTADTATLTAGSSVVTLTVGTSGAEVNINSLTFTSGETSSVTSLVVTFPA